MSLLNMHEQMMVKIVVGGTIKVVFVYFCIYLFCNDFNKDLCYLKIGHLHNLFFYPISPMSSD